MQNTCISLLSRLLSCLSISLLAACDGGTSSTSAPAAGTVAATPADAAVEDCAPEQGIEYLCGLRNGEDILALGSSGWLLVSGMNNELFGGPALNGHLYLVDPRGRAWRELFPGTAPVFEQNLALFGDCPGPIDAAHFSAHGLALQPLDDGGSQQYRLYLTSHGAREAIEVFEIDAPSQPAIPTIKWVGCVPIPGTAWMNSVVVLRDGGFLATQFFDTAEGIESVFSDNITGRVFEWHPGGEVTAIPGTELSGANGIALSDDERYVFVTTSGSHEVVRFDRSQTPPGKEAVQIGSMMDNIRWSSDGTLYATGGNITTDCEDSAPICIRGWSVFEIEPSNLSATRLTGAPATAALQCASSALPVDDEIWVGTCNGDRLAILPKP